MSIIDITTRKSVESPKAEGESSLELNEAQKEIIRNLQDALVLANQGKIKTLAMQAIDSDDNVMTPTITMGDLEKEIYKISALVEVTSDQLKSYRDHVMMGVFEDEYED